MTLPVACPKSPEVFPPYPHHSPPTYHEALPRKFQPIEQPSPDIKVFLLSNSKLPKVSPLSALSPIPFSPRHVNEKERATKSGVVQLEEKQRLTLSPTQPQAHYLSTRNRRTQPRTTTCARACPRPPHRRDGAAALNPIRRDWSCLIVGFLINRLPSLESRDWLKGVKLRFMWMEGHKGLGRFPFGEGRIFLGRELELLFDGRAEKGAKCQLKELILR